VQHLTSILTVLCAITAGCSLHPGPRVGIAVHGTPTPEQITEWTDTLGMTPKIILFFTPWPSVENQLTASIPSDALSAIHSQNIIPCLSWEPHTLIGDQEYPILADSILSGQYDPYIQRLASAIRNLNQPVWIRFAHEMNLERYHWGVAKEQYNSSAPEKYRLMFRYVVEKFKEYGTENIEWVFCPNAESLPVADWNTIESYWPGTEFVDILGVDGYNWGTSQTVEKNGWQSDWRSFQSIFEPVVLSMRTRAPGKPLFVMETACVHQGGDRTRWIEQMIEQATLWGIDGICWFQADKENAWALNPELDTQSLHRLRKWSR